MKHNYCTVPIWLYSLVCVGAGMFGMTLICIYLGLHEENKSADSNNVS